MSRSKRKSWVTCGYGGLYKKFAKRQANKRIRKLDIFTNFCNMLYKKFYESWDICDFKWFDESKKASRK